MKQNGRKQSEIFLRQANSTLSIVTANHFSTQKTEITRMH